MKSKFLALACCLSFACTPLLAQKQVRLGLGWYDASLSHPGVVLELELETPPENQVSLPFRFNAGYFTDPDFRVFFLDLHKGFRKYFRSGWLLEQSIGLGVMATYYDLDNLYYFDRYGHSIRYVEGANISIMPSVDVAIAYRFGEHDNRIWIRPKVYWDLGLRSLAFPYAAVQVGFSYTLNAR